MGNADEAPKAQSGIRFAKSINLLVTAWIPGGFAMVGLAIGAATANVPLLIVSACVGVVALYALMRTPKSDKRV